MFISIGHAYVVGAGFGIVQLSEYRKNFTLTFNIPARDWQAMIGWYAAFITIS